ncbi:MAG: UbiA family prenyltransferase [Calditrichia bacterium]|nr:UbiA family prenyltransferase [Calditrichia bacterium]
MLNFIKLYIKSMRLYYSFVTGIAGWIGVAYYEHMAKGHIERTIEFIPLPEKKFVILILLFLSWGVNQIINDYLGLKEDRINAPERPMVTGELNPQWALSVSIFLLFITSLITYFYLEPFAIIFLFTGVLLNILYEYAKAYGILGNIVFGLMITQATLYGAYASGPTASTFVQSHRLSGLFLIWVINGLMTFYTYFKDYKGDKAAGKKTIIVKYGLRKSRVLAIVSAFLPTITFFVLKESNLLWIDINNTFIILGTLTVFLQIWTGVLYYLNPVGEKTYASLRTNFQACVCGQAAIVAFFNPELAIWLFIFSYIFVGFLFELHMNPKS